MNILYEDNHLIVAVKPHNIPSQADISGDEDMLTLLKAYIKEKYNKQGNVYLGLLHRLDRPTSGVMVFARTSKAAARLTKQFADRTAKKEYTALVYGTLADSGELVDNLKKDEKTNIVSVVDQGGKYAALSYRTVGREGEWTRVKIELKTGRSHQIRVQFASRNHALKGDAKYGRGGGKLCLCATHLSFMHPTKNELMEFSIKEDF